MDGGVDQFPEQLLKPSRLKMLGLMVLTALGTAVGVWIISEGEAFGWFFAGLFGLCSLFFALVLLPNSSYLHIGPQGFTARTIFRSHTCRWADVERFQVASVGVRRNRMVVFNFSPDFSAYPRARKLAAAMSGYEGALPDSYGKSPEELAALLNDYRSHFGAAE